MYYFSRNWVAPATCAWWVVGVNGARGRPAACMWSMPVVRCGDSGWCGGGPPDADAVIDAAYLYMYMGAVLSGACVSLAWRGAI